MDVFIACDGIPIGVATFTPFEGLAHATFEPLPAYAAVRHHAEAIGRRLGGRFWRAIEGDFADELARSWSGGRLAVCDFSYVELGVASVVIIDWRSDRYAPRVVVDARSDMSRVEAFLRTLGGGDDGRSRPAA